MEQWIRCNKCFRSMKNTRKVFSLTQCQHVFCSNCIFGVKEQCPRCKSVNVLIMTLQKPLHQSLKPYFEPLSGHMEQVCQAANLQHTQALITLDRARGIEDKYEILKKAYSKAASMKKELCKACLVLNEKIFKLEHRWAMYRACERTEIIGRSHRTKTSRDLIGSHQNSSLRQTAKDLPTNEVVHKLQCRELAGSSQGGYLSWNHSSLPNNWQQENSQLSVNPMISQGIEKGWTSRRNAYVAVQTANCGLRGRNTSVFTPHRYQPRAILSDSSESPTTPVRNYSRYPNSIQSSSNISSSICTPDTPNYSLNCGYKNSSNF